MAYNKEELFEKAKEVVKGNHTVYFVNDIIAYLPCQKSAFYDHFPADSVEMETLKELLEDNKINMKVKLRNKLAKGEKAAEILALYRLICTPEERQMLNQSYIDHTSNGKEIKQITGFNID